MGYMYCITVRSHLIMQTKHAQTDSYELTCKYIQIHT